MDITRTQNRIKNIVGAYKAFFPIEYKAVVEWVEKNRRLQANEFASMKANNNMLERALFEIPEKLMSSLLSELSDEEMKYLKAKQGGRWFAKTFKEFALATKI